MTTSDCPSIGGFVDAAALSPRLDPADKEVVQQFVERLRRQILAEMAARGTPRRQAGRKRDRRGPRANPERRLSVRPKFACVISM